MSKTFLFQAIHFNLSTLFSYQVLPLRDQSGPGSEGNEEDSPKLQHYWNLTIRLFSVISGHSLEES